MKNIRFIIGSILMLLWLPGPPPCEASVNYTQSQSTPTLRSCLERVAIPAGPQSLLMNAVIRFYEERQFQPAWMGSEGLTPQGADLLAALKSPGAASVPGLIAYLRYLENILQDGRQIMSVASTFPRDDLLEVEIGITQSVLYFAILHSADRLFPDAEPAEHQASPLAEKLAEALQGSTWDLMLKAATPQQKPFQALKKALARLNTIRRLGGWPTMPEGRRMSPGCKDSRVPLLRRRLIISSDTGLETLSLDEVYDAPLIAGVRRFQHRHGLKADGVVGPTTLAELNTTVEERITQIKLNMLRWYRMPERLGQRYLLANIPGFRLYVVENHQIVRSIRTIVGKPERPTPVMSALMTYLEINPYWNIPQQIARTDILPKINADALFLLHNDIEIFDSWREDAAALDPSVIDWKRYSEAYFPFRLRQKPSTSNALGRIKFIFPNKFSVYIHDTPAKSLFSKNNRSYSSGCVRIENPLVLADYLLAEQGWSKDKIESKVKSRKRTVVVLKDPIPVHLAYLTAWADLNDTIYFYHDLYGRDRHILEGPDRPDDRQPVLAFDPVTTDRIVE